MRIIGEGIAALKQTLTPELFSRLNNCCAQVTTGGSTANGAIMRLDGSTGERIDGLLGSPPGNPPVAGPSPGTTSGPPRQEVQPLNGDRTVLRSVLSQGLEEYTEFGKDFSSYEITPTGVTVRFNDGSEVQGSLLVGADGSRSRVRKQFLPERQALLDTEGRFIYGKTLLTPELVEKFEDKAMKGLTLVQDLSDEAPLSLLLEPIRFKDNEFRSELPDDYVYWVLMSKKGHLAIDDAAAVNLSPEGAAALAQKLTSHWHHSFHPLFALQDATKASLLRIISSQPEIPVWEPSSYVTLIGDAIHVMSPTAGVGATSAFRDSALLAQLLTDEGVHAGSIEKYEASMRVYAGEAIKRSTWGGKWLFGMPSFEAMKAVAE